MKGVPDLRLLTSFMAVVEHGSMTAAATALGYVPSAISQHVTALEDALGAELLVRRPGSRLVLSPAGRRVVFASRDLFAAAAAFADATADVEATTLSNLRLGAYGTAMSHVLPQVLERLGRDGPLDGIRLVEVETAGGLALVQAGEIDVLLAYRYLPEDPPAASSRDLRVVQLGREPMVLVAAAGRASELTLDDAGRTAWVAGGPGDADRRLLGRWAAQAGLSPDVRFETSDCRSAVALIECGQAVGLVPATVVASSPGLGRVRVAETPLPYRDVLAVTRTTSTSEVVGVLLDQIRDHLAAQGCELEPTDS